jgi:tetratricopeptide (TPR) repeat protein
MEEYPSMTAVKQCGKLFSAIYRVLSILLSAIIVAVSLCPAVEAGAGCDKWVARVVSVEGTVQVYRSGSTGWANTAMNDTLCAGDRLQLGKNSRATVVLFNETILRLDQLTELTFRPPPKKNRSIVDILRGVVNFFSRVPRGLEVLTPFVNGAVEGTEFLVRVDADRTTILVFKGLVAAANGAGRLNVGSGQAVVARRGKAPQPMVVVKPREAVHWALYYPVVTSPARTPEKDSAPWFMARAAGLLKVGRVDEARENIARALAVDPRNSDAYALKAIMAVVQNRRDDALALAEKAVALGDRSAAARLALSYARQARFDLPGALKALDEAAGAHPRNALVKARLSELYLAMGDVDKSLAVAREAMALNPDIGRTQTVLGFAYLARMQTAEAQKAFARAAALDPAAPLPRLGQGLAEIRQGDLEGGRGDIEIAAALDPGNSLIRSYLGKAFYAEKRARLSGDQYSVAKQLDPADPTPWFYDAILKQTLNRPVEALQDMQHSITLNDNRAVYRSRLLLDEDLAARSAGLGRIYSDLGFQQLALVEGWQSVNTDPANYSAHRFLSDMYGALPRHQIAQVSELLLSQLLQPINITPVQPQLADSNLFVLDGAGPSDPSFNEFNPLFLRNRLAIQAAGVAGGNHTVGDEVIQSGVWDRFSYSLGQYYYETDGFRENNGQNQHILNAFTQVNLGPRTSVLGEIRYRDDSFGDLQLLFYPDLYTPGLEHNHTRRTYRLGFHHGFSPRSDVLVSVIGQDIDEDLSAPIEVGAIGVNESTDGYLAEGQHLYRRKRLNITSGIGYYDASQDKSTTFLSSVPFIPDQNRLESPDTSHTNLYTYARLQPVAPLTVTAGVSYDDFDDDRVDTNQFNPKFGLTWTPFSKTTLRAAAFRVLTRTLISDQTLEPTQVAGFNQFFDDVPGTSTWVYGGAIDQKFSSRLFGGGAFFKRDMDVPYRQTLLNTSQIRMLEASWDEYVGRAYLYWAPHPMLAASIEYLYEDFNRGDEFTGFGIFSDVTTQRLRLGGGFFHPSGFFTRLYATHVNQQVDLGDQSYTGPPGSDSDYFWVVDAALGYRLPRRLGIFTLEAKNLFNKSFHFQDTDPAHPTIAPEFLLLTRLTLAF